MSFESVWEGLVNLVVLTDHISPSAKYWVWYQLRKGDDINPAAQEKYVNLVISCHILLLIVDIECSSISNASTAC